MELSKMISKVGAAKRVVVIGEKQAPESLRTSCNRFVEI